MFFYREWLSAIPCADMKISADVNRDYFIVTSFFKLCVIF